MKTIFKAFACTSLAVCLAYTQPAFAADGVIVAPTSGTINSGGPGFGPISQTFDQSGLASNYTPGVTDFDTYIGTNPQHSYPFIYEWFSNSGTSSASVTYDMGSVMGLDELALWNEDASGIGTLDLYGSTDGVGFSLLGTFNPFDNPINSDYGPQVFGFAPTMAQYLRFDMSNCPQSGDAFEGCAIGEVAFRTAAVGSVPEPATWALMLLGFGAIGWQMRRRDRAIAQPA